MVLRCSLLGHDFGDAEVEREREERGSEVVITVQEFEECVRCGERNVISENTEVTSLAAGTGADSRPHDHEPEPTEPPLEPDAAAESSSEADAGFIDAGGSDEPAAAVTDAGDPPTETDAEFIDADEPGSEGDTEFFDTNDPDSEPDAEFIDDDPSSGTDAEFIDDAGSDSETDAEFIDTDADADTAVSAATSAPEHSDAVTGPAETTDDDIDLPTDENGDPVVDDGEILKDEDDPAPERDREHGEWPDSSDVGPPSGGDPSPAAWPDDDDGDADTEAPSRDGESDPTPADDDAVVLENDVPADTTDDPRSVTADPPTDATDDASADAASEPDTGIERADSAPTPTERDSGPTDNVPTEFYCPRCDYVAAGNRGSLRAGDICPDCRKGYLSERERR